jgi:Putative heavy-metal-binding
MAAAPPGSWDSGLTTPDFAACLSMGLEPLRLAQGFFCGQIAAWSSYQAQIINQYACPWGYRRGEHPPPGWLGVHATLDQAWSIAFSTALQRLVAEAEEVGAQGIVGVQVDMSHPTNQNSSEVHLWGTAVRVPGAAPGPIWATRIAGHKLAKLVEAGYVPSEVIYARCTGVMYEGCYMEHYGPRMVAAGTPLAPIQDVHNLARGRALQEASRLTNGQSLYDVELSAHESESGETTYVTVQVLGSAVRRVRPTSPLAVPIPTLSLHD